MEIELFNIDIERKVLHCLMYDKELMIRTVNKKILTDKVFSDRTLRTLFRIFTKFFNKNGRLIPQDILANQVDKLSERTKNAELFKKKINSVVEVFFDKKPKKETLDNFDVYVNELNVLCEGRMLQEFQFDLFNKIDTADITGAKELFQAFRLPNYDEEIDEGDYTSDLKERERIVLQKKNNPEAFSLLPTGIEPLDMALGGGVTNEFCVVSGSSNAGKSLLLGQIATNAWKAKKTVILFPIGEMDKVQTQNRIDCNIAEIPYDFFRNPVDNYSIENHKKWRKSVLKYKERCGILEVVGFRRTARVSDIVAKTYDIMNKYQKPIDGIFIDSIDNLATANGVMTKDYLGFEEICWDLFMLTKSFKNMNGTFGIPVWASTQLKKVSKEISSSKKTRVLREDDVGSSPFQFRYSEVFIGMKTIVENRLSELQIMKGRGISKSVGIDCFHNFPYGRYHDPKKKDEALQGIDEDEKKVVEEMEIEVEEGDNSETT